MHAGDGSTVMTITANAFGREPSLSPKMCEEAMEWWLDMQEANFDSPAQAAFMAWRSEHPLHELAWEKALALGAQLDSLRTQGDPDLARQALLLPSQEGLSRRRAIKGLALLLAAGTGAWLGRDSELMSRMSADYTTGVGERRRVALASDLSLELNTRSAINARTADQRWHLRLLSGEVLINTALNPALFIETAQVRAQASSARFTMRQFDYGTGFDVSGPLTETGNVRGRLVADFKTEQSWIDRYKQDSQLIYGITEFDLTEDTLLTMGFSYQRTDVDSPMRSGLPTRFTDGSRSNLKRSLNSAQTWSYNDHEQTSFFTSIEQQFANGWSGKIELTHSENKFDEVFNYVNGSLNPDGSGTTQLPVRFSGVPRQNNIDAYLTGPFDLLGREHELIAGVTLSNYYENVPSYGGWKYDYSGSPAGAIDNLLNWNGASVKPQFDVTGKSTVDETQYAAYLATRLHATDDLSILLGSRVIDWHREIEDKPYNAEHTKTKESETGVYIPYAGVVYDVNDTWSLYASYTKIFNPQSSWVRDINNKPLDPMEGTGYEVGVKGSHFDGKLNSSIALFKIEQDNLAIWIDTPGGNTYKSEQGTTTKGAEFTLDGELAEGWQASAGYAYAVSTDADDQRIVTTLPRHSLKTFTSYRLPGILDKVTIGGGVNWQSKTGADLHTFTQGRYAVTNLLARYDFNQHLSASVNLNNVFDREYLSYAGDHGMYGAPRNIMTGIKYTF